MDSRYEIGLHVATTSDDGGMRQVEHGLKRVHDEAQRGGAIWDGLGKKVLGFIAAFIGFQKVVGWLKSAFQGAVDAESSLLRLGNTMLAFDPTTKRTAEGVREWAEALTKITGVSHELTEGIVMRFLPVVKNIDAAMHLAASAAQAQKRGWTDAASAADLLGNAIMGRPIRGTDILSRLLFEGHLKGEDFAVTLDKIEKALATTGTATDSAALKLARMKEQQEETKEAVGATFIKLLDALQPVAKGFALFVGYVVSGFGFIIEMIKLVAKNLHAMGVLVAELPSGPQKAWKKFNQALVSNQDILRENFGVFARMVADIRKAFDKDTSAIDALSKKADEEAKKRIAETYARLKAEREREARERAAKEAAETRAKRVTEEAEDEIKRRQQRAAQETQAAAYLNVEEALNAKMLAALRLHEGRVLQIKQLANANIKKMDAQQLANYVAMLRQELAAEVATMQERNRLTLQLARAEYEIKTKGQQQIVQASLAAGQQIFAANKELSAALAIVSAFAAAAGAARDTQGDVYTRIAAYIAAFAQVWMAVVGIGETELKGGGGGAGAAGASPPAPMVYTGTSRAAAPPTSTSTTNVTTNAPATTVVNVQALDTTNALRSAQRALRPASRSYDKTLPSRGAVVVGTRRPR